MYIIILIILIGLLYYKNNLKNQIYLNLKKKNNIGNMTILQDIIYNEKNKLDINNRCFYK